jgi:hypothetical protein
LGTAALVHRAVALRHLVKGRGQVEDRALVDFPVLHQIDQLGQEAAHWWIVVRERTCCSATLWRLACAIEASVPFESRSCGDIFGTPPTYRMLRIDCGIFRSNSN